ncbi:M1 family aminopeptidase [Candidatus Neomarinimicrobiota bacterium]
MLAWLLLVLLPASFAFSQELPLTQQEYNELRQAEINTKRALFDRYRLAKSRQATPSQEAFDVTYYRLDLTLNPDDSLITGTVLIQATVLADTLDKVVLDFLSTMVTDRVEQAAGFIHENDTLAVRLEQPLAAGDTFSIVVAYHGRPVSDSRDGFGFDLQNGTPIIWSLSQPYFARGWWPCKDVPNDKADSVDIILTVPENLYAVSNGSLQDNNPNGDGTRTFHWHESYPIATYLVSVAVTNYNIYTDWFRYTADDSMEVSLYLYPSSSQSPQDLLDQLDNMLTYFHQVFGPYPFITEKYGIAQFPLGGGMEHQTVTSQGTFGEMLTAHELAHMWWGDKITNARWGDIWLNEGFSSYAEALYTEYMYGEDYFRGYMEWMDRDYPYPIFVTDTTDRHRLFNITVYDKAAWFLHMLRHVVGDSTFFEILLEYSSDPRFAYGNATTAGFRDVCETVSGQELNWFFEPWIYHAGRPRYQVGWNSTESAGWHQLSIHINQTQVPLETLFPMPIDITITTEAGDTVVTVFNDLPEQHFEFLIADRPTGIVLDEEGWILKQMITDATGGPIPPIEFALEQSYPNPFRTSATSAARIRYDLPRTANVSLRIYDLLGREISTLANGSKPMGTYNAIWYGVNHSGEPVPNGIYFYYLELRDPIGGGVSYSRTRKMILLR